MTLCNPPFIVVLAHDGFGSPCVGGEVVIVGGFEDTGQVAGCGKEAF